MIIKLENIIPFTLRDKLNPRTEIWGKTVSLNSGDFNLIKAVSGSGKSTFIDILYGIRKDYSGDLFYDHDLINNFSNNDLSSIRKTEISIVFQDLRLFNGLTAAENILINSSDSKELSTEQIRQAKKLNVTGLLHKKTALLSYGERQRVAILRALSQEYKFLLLDEPFSHLDKENAMLAYELITEDTSNKKAGIVMTTLGNEDFLSPTKTLLL